MAELDPELVEASLKATNPVAAGSISCVDYSVDVFSIEYGTPVLTITGAEGAVQMMVELSDLKLKADVEADLCGLSSIDERIIVTDTLTTITTDIEVSYVDRFAALAVNLENSAVSYTDLDIDWGTVDSALSTLGIDPTSLVDVGAIIEDAILGVVEAEVPPPIIAAIEAMEISEDLDVLGVPVTLSAELSAIDVTTEGVEVMLSTNTTGPSADPELPALPGTLTLGGDAPELDAATQLSLSLFLDELNRVLYNAHSSGAFRIYLTDTELGLEPALIDFVFPGATTLNLTFEPSLPPVLLPQESGSDLDLRLVSLALVANGEVDGVDTELVSGFVHVVGTVTAGISSDGDIALEVTDVTPLVDVVVTDPSGVAEAEALEDTLAGISMGIIGELFPTISFAIPEIEGMTLTGTGAATAGPTNSWVRIEAEITE
jgi:hypothetical protein